MCGSCYSESIIDVDFPSLHMWLLARYTYLNVESICTDLILCHIDCLLAGSCTSNPILSCISWKTGIKCQKFAFLCASVFFTWLVLLTNSHLLALILLVQSNTILDHRTGVQLIFLEVTSTWVHEFKKMELLESRLISSSSFLFFFFLFFFVVQLYLCAYEEHAYLHLLKLSMDVIRRSW